MQTLYAGAGSCIIHFPESLFPIDGFKGIHDAPAVRVLVLNNSEKAALVALELVMLPPGMINEIKAIVSHHTGIHPENIWIHTTHAITTPHAPHAPVGPGGIPVALTEEERSNLIGKQHLYTAAVISAAAAAAQAAAKNMRPSSLGTGYAVSQISINRDIKTPFGWWIGSNLEGITDPVFDLIRFDDEYGRPIAHLIFGSLKPCAIDNSQMKETQRLVSSDIPGFACRTVEAALRAPCFFFMGAAGDQVPREQAMWEEVAADGTVSIVDKGVRAGLEIVERLGKEFAEALIPALQNIHCSRAASSIQVDETSISWKSKSRLPLQPRTAIAYSPADTVTVTGNIMTIAGIAFVGLRPEVNVITGKQLKAQSPYKKTILISMVNGGQKYMPDQQSYDKITWEAQNAMLMPGAAEAWVKAVSLKLNDLFEKGQTDETN